jgi:hypothetical protein
MPLKISLSMLEAVRPKHLEERGGLFPFVVASPDVIRRRVGTTKQSHRIVTPHVILARWKIQRDISSPPEGFAL